MSFYGSKKKKLMCFWLSERADIARHGLSQHHPSNWVDAGEEEDEGDEAELCVQSTPPYNEE